MTSYDVIILKFQVFYVAYKNSEGIRKMSNRHTHKQYTDLIHLK